jgi:hypothetical protein
MIHHTRHLRADGRYELRRGAVVLMEAPGRIGVEVYAVKRGLETFQGYLHDRATPDRMALLRLWMSSIEPLQVPRLSGAVAADLWMAANRLKMEYGYRVVRL